MLKYSSLGRFAFSFVSGGNLGVLPGVLGPDGVVAKRCKIFAVDFNEVPTLAYQLLKYFLLPLAEFLLACISHNF